MANIKNLISDIITSNIVKGQSYEGLPIASDIKNGIVKIDNLTIRYNDKGQLYCTITIDSESFDDTIIVKHMNNESIHLSLEQENSISSSSAHVRDDTKHLSTLDKETLDKVNPHVLNTDIHIDQEKANSIELSVNHTNDTTKHLSVTDRDNLNNISSHTDNLNIHVTEEEKNSIVNINNHIARSSIHLTPEDRDNINTTLSIASTFPDHMSDSNVHFVPYEKEIFIRNLSTNTSDIEELNKIIPSINDLALNKLDNKNHEINKMLVTDETGNIVYSDITTGGDTVAGKRFYIQQEMPTGTKVGDVWISW